MTSRKPYHSISVTAMFIIHVKNKLYCDAFSCDTEAYLEPSQTSAIACFCEIS